MVTEVLHANVKFQNPSSCRAEPFATNFGLAKFSRFPRLHGSLLLNIVKTNTAPTNKFTLETMSSK